MHSVESKRACEKSTGAPLRLTATGCAEELRDVDDETVADVDGRD